ncbi:MAG: ribonuclease HII [Salibacteraceae bacterium]|nr:ribonuclease HII [Salibacteraceae bacterium]MDP4687903.1 ribonuclease HII [Salibacteraceae bacterium]MDP4764270.1 ribonuclease HII [Salibacteraceae bacterium]MDP4933324.1 ribonuclease HII [Salibacteraceae bacterium]MDP4965680.1 ribonuclease HII [Salibacteraceae bacterium]
MLKARLNNKRLEAGCDEVGRGCLAGPVVAAAVILPANFKHPNLNDSKQLSEKKRLELTAIIQDKALAWAVSFVEPIFIDRINILNASFLAMNRAVGRLTMQPEYLLIDGNRFRTKLDIPYECIIKGDSKNGSIAAASILAKTYRDYFMALIHEDFPVYDWHKNVGYPTKKHREAIKSFGATPHHRKSFQLLPAQLTIDL